jgi:hypothetical protein
VCFFSFFVHLIFLYVLLGGWEVADHGVQCLWKVS